MYEFIKTSLRVHHNKKVEEHCDKEESNFINCRAILAW